MKNAVTPLGFLLAAVAAALGFLFAVDGSLADSLDAFVAGIHAAPALIAATWSMTWSKKSSATAWVALGCAVVSAIFMAWASSVASSDAQGALIYLLLTPICVTGIVSIFSIVAWILSRKASDTVPSE